VPKNSKLCILRLSAIGDVCHAVAMVERIQRSQPDIEITWIIGKLEHQLVGDMANIKFVIFDKKQGRAAYKKLKQDLAGQVFDTLFVMQVALRANLAALLIKAKQKIGFDWQRSKELHCLFANKRISPQPHAHVLDGFMAFADALGIPHVAKPQWHIPVAEPDLLWAMAQKAKWGDFVVISPAASKAERNWLPQRYAKIADYLHQHGKTVILCGGPGKLDQQLGEQISAHTQNIACNYIGQTSLKQMLALLAQASLVIAPDTGPAHMATAVGTPVIGLYAHSNPLRTGPYNNLDNVVSVYDEIVKEQKGKPWQQLNWGVRVKGEDLMARITIDQVIEQLVRLGITDSTS
jgi:heptosyltransferase I